MAGPYASLTSPYAPGPDRMTSAFRIADLIGQQGQSAARAKLAHGLMVGNLVGDIGGTVGGIFQRRDEQRQNAEIAAMIASGQPVDLAAILAKVGPERAKTIYPMVEAAITKREATEKKRIDDQSRGAFADSVLNDPTASPEKKALAEAYRRGGSMPPASLLTDPKVAAEAAEKAAAQKKIDDENALVATIAESVKHGMPETEAQQLFASKTGGKVLPASFFRAPAPEKASNPANPTEASLALLAAQGDTQAAKALALLRAQRADSGGAAGPKLTGAQQDDLATMDTVVDLAGLATTLGDKIGWKGVGGLWTGTIAGQAAKQLGWGTADEENLRNYLGNIQGTIAKLRGGTAFSAAEKAMLDSYTPGTNDADHVIQAKLKSLGEFIALKRANTLRIAGGDAGGGRPTQPPSGGAPVRGSGPYSVKTPQGEYRFQTKAKLDEFKQKAGIP